MVNMISYLLGWLGFSPMYAYVPVRTNKYHR